MADILFQFETVAATARTVAPMKKVIIAMLTIQSAPSAIDRATSQNKLLFALYMFLLLLIAFVSWLVWKSGNRLQDEIRSDANARIAEADSKAASANENAGKANERAGVANDSAAKANERGQKLENDNIQLRTDLEAATAESRTKQAELAKEQSKLATEQRKTAEAQRDAAEAQRALAEVVEKRTAPRQLSAQQKDAFLEELKKHVVSEIGLICAGGSEESCDFGREFFDLFKTAGWVVKNNEVGRAVVQRPQPGVAFFIPSSETVSTTQPGLNWTKFEKELVPRLIAIIAAFKAIGVNVDLVQDLGRTPADGISIFFGPKP